MTQLEGKLPLTLVLRRHLAVFSFLFPTWSCLAYGLEKHMYVFLKCYLFSMHTHQLFLLFLFLLFSDMS